MKSLQWSLAGAVGLLLAGFVCGCRSLQATDMGGASEKLEKRNNCSSLLYDLLGQQKDVSKLLLIKAERPELNRLIKSISSRSAAGRKTLEHLVEKDPTLHLRNVALPAGELATRDAIARTQTKELLAASGADFEFKLLLSQVEALTYAWHLAKVAAECETRTEASRVLANLRDEMQRLHQEAVGLLHSRISAPHTVAGSDKGKK